MFRLSHLMFVVCFTFSAFAQTYFFAEGRKQETWDVIKTPVDVNLSKVIYLDSLHVWAAGDSGTIIFSSDKGMTWEMQNSGLNYSIQDIFFLNTSFGWALTFYLDGIRYQSQILSTTNGGKNWDIQNYPMLDIVLKTIWFTDSLTGYVGGHPFELAYTIDGGRTWLPATLDSSAQIFLPIRQIKFSTKKYGFAVGGAIDLAGSVWFSNDSGYTWKGYLVAPDIFDDFIFLDTTIAFSLSADIEAFYPIGKLHFDFYQNSWGYTELNKYGRVTGLSKQNNSVIWGTIGNFPNFIKSTDKGETWELISTPDSIYLFDAEFIDSLNGIAVGEKGFVLRFTADYPSQILGAQINTVKQAILYQNFPNPFNSATTIKWFSPTPAHQNIKIFDILGNEIATLIDDFVSSGKHEIQFDASLINLSLASGIYFYQIKIGANVQTKKMIYLR